MKGYDTAKRLTGALDKLRSKSHRVPRCMAREAAPSPCKSKVIEAHSISKSSTLKPIAEHGTVLSYEEDFPDPRKDLPTYAFQRHGISRASTFRGFCKHHDSELFSCIENEAFEGRADQCSALAYRSASIGLYVRDAGERFCRDAPDVVRRFDPSLLEAARLHYGLEGHRFSHARAASQSVFEALSECLAVGESEGMSHLIIAYDGLLPFAFTGSFAPIWDLINRPLQAMNAGSGFASCLTVNTITAHGRSYVILSSFEQITGPLAPLIEQIHRLRMDRVGGAVAELVLEGVGTVFFSPRWIEELSDDQCGRLERLLVHGATYALGPTPWANLSAFPGVPQAVSVREAG